MPKVLYGVGGAFVLVSALFLVLPHDPSASEAAPADPIAEVSIVAEEELAAAAVTSQSTVTEVPRAKPSRTDALYAVTRVVDGDTITINMSGTAEVLRLIGIDTPETGGTSAATECFGSEASNKTKELLTGRKVRIEKDSSQGERDKYDRLLAYVYREDGLFINKYLVENGYAREYTYNKPYRHQAGFRAAQNTAKAQGRGLWASGACAQPAVTSSAGHVAPVPAVAPQPQIVPPTPPPTPQSEPHQSAPAPTPSSPAPAPSASQYTCSANTYNCSDFSTHVEAQAVFDMCGGVGHDIHKLDSNKDGEACESLP
ncbi:thermonuclease family protein [Candidatus Kaiserbacteria bacterium]|nr:thermonuclease family protein [Candidatus Kaiserbacteria bacterium]